MVAPAGAVVAQRRFAEEHANGARVWVVEGARSVIVTAPDGLREQLPGLPVQRLVVRCSRLRRSSSAPADELARRQVLRSLARRIEAAIAEAAELEREILAHVRALAPQLLDEPGVGRSSLPK